MIGERFNLDRSARAPRPKQPEARFAKCVECGGRFREEECISDSGAKWRCKSCVAKRYGPAVAARLGVAVEEGSQGTPPS